MPLDHAMRILERLRVRHGNDVVAGVDEMDLAGHAAGQAGGVDGHAARIAHDDLAAAWRVAVTGLVRHRLSLSLVDLKDRPRREITLQSH